MSITDDFAKGRELYRRRSSGGRQNKHSKPSKIVIGFGMISEQLMPIWKRVVSLPDKAAMLTQPYMVVVRRDIKFLWGIFVKRVVERFPKKEYDPLGEAWKRGRRGI